MINSRNLRREDILSLPFLSRQKANSQNWLPVGPRIMLLCKLILSKEEDEKAAAMAMATSSSSEFQHPDADGAEVLCPALTSLLKTVFYFMSFICAPESGPTLIMIYKGWL